MTLYLVCDTSGSMGEDGRVFIMRTAVMTIAQWLRLGYGSAPVKLCAWAAQATSLPDWDTGQEFPAQLLCCRGTSNWKALTRFFAETSDTKILLLSDGFWSRSDAKIYRQWKDCLPAGTLRVVKIGPDASPQLKGADVFATEDLFAALDGWLESGLK